MTDKKVLFAELSLVVITVIWGLGFPITKLALNQGFGVNSIMASRFVIASILLAIVYRKKLKLINKQYLIYGSLTGVFLFFGFYLQTVGNVYTTASKNGFITQLNIVLVPFLYFLFFKKKVDRYNIFSIVVAIIGMFVLNYSKGEFSNLNIGDFLTFLCAIMVAFHVTTGSFFQKKYDFDPAVFVLINIATAMVFSLAFVIAFESLPIITSVFDLWPLLFLGVLNTALGFLVQSYALKVSIPTRISLIVTLESIFSVIGAVLILNEIVTPGIVFGGLLIISAVLINELKPFKKKKKY